MAEEVDLTKLKRELRAKRKRREARERISSLPDVTKVIRAKEQVARLSTDRCPFCGKALDVSPLIEIEDRGKGGRKYNTTLEQCYICNKIWRAHYQLVSVERSNV